MSAGLFKPKDICFQTGVGKERGRVNIMDLWRVMSSKKWVSRLAEDLSSHGGQAGRWSSEGGGTEAGFGVRARVDAEEQESLF